jgi:DNA-directed RNA polymerase specialized sigma24 family protein
MATVTTVCLGGQWQDDFLAVVRRAERYFGAIFRSFRHDAADMVQEALCCLLEDFRKHWQPGATFQLQMRFIAVSILQGLRFSDRKGRGKKLRIKSNRVKAIARAKARAALLEAELDFKEALGRLSSKYQRIIRMLLEGYTKAEIHRLVGACHRTVGHAIDALFGQL